MHSQCRSLCLSTPSGPDPDLDETSGQINYTRGFSSLVQLTELELIIPSLHGSRLLSLPCLSRLKVCVNTSMQFNSDFRETASGDPRILPTFLLGPHISANLCRRWDRLFKNIAAVDAVIMFGVRQNHLPGLIVPSADPSYVSVRTWHLQVDSVFKREFDSKTLWHLKSLTLSGLGIDSLGIWLCSSMGQLTYLDLSANEFKVIPAGVAQLTALQELSFKCNKDLQLVRTDLNLLVALGKLEKMDLSKDEFSYGQKAWTAEELGILWALSKRMPDLQCTFSRRDVIWGIRNCGMNILELAHCWISMTQRSAHDAMSCVMMLKHAGFLSIHVGTYISLPSCFQTVQGLRARMVVLCQWKRSWQRWGTCTYQDLIEFSSWGW